MVRGWTAVVASFLHIGARRRASDRLVADGGLLLRLPFQPPLDWDAMLSYLAARVTPGVESVSHGTYRRTVLIDGDPGVIELSPGGQDHLLFLAHLPHWEGLIHIAQRARRIFALDADLEAATRYLQADPVIGPLLCARPGLRPPGTWDPFETGVRAIVGRALGVARATAITARLVERHGTPVPGLRSLALTHLFPSPTALARADLGELGLTPRPAAAVEAFARAVADGAIRLDRGGTLDDFVRAYPAIGGWPLRRATTSRFVWGNLTPSPPPTSGFGAPSQEGRE